MKAATALLFALALSGCATYVDPAASKSDIRACQLEGREAGKKVPLAEVILFGPMFTSREARRDAFEDCMYARGFKTGGTKG